MSSQVPKFATTVSCPILDGEYNPDISIPAQASTTTRPRLVGHSSGDDGHPGIPQALPTASESQALEDRDAPNREVARDSNPGTSSIASLTIDYSPMEAKNERDHGVPIRTEMSFITPEHPSIDRGGEDVPSRETGHELNPNLSIPKRAPMTTELHSVDHGYRVVKQGNAPSTSFFQGSSNVEITGSNFYEVRGNATIIRFGDGQFIDVQKNLICDYIANPTVLPDINNDLEKHVKHILTHSIISLPRAKAVFDDYQNKKKSGPCFKGTREALLREMADWATTSSESRMYILSGLAGIGKSTVAYTIASRAADLNLLGASFFFSRDEADRKNAEILFTTIAYQLCVYNKTFAKAIGDVLQTERGSAAITKDPLDQLQALILDPLRSIVQSHSRPVLVVIDALDECDEEDAISVLAGLSQFVQELPSFKVILTTRPQPHFDRFLCSQCGHKIFRLQDIEDKVVDGDIRLFLNHSLSLAAVRGRYPQRQWCASAEEIDSLVRAAGRLFIIASTTVRYIFDKSASNPGAQMEKLLDAFSRYLTPFKDLDEFYTVILRNVVPENCDNDDTVSRYQSVVGAIIIVQRPLPVSALSPLINMDVDDIHAMLDQLQSVILLKEDDVPRIYHKSFPDYLTDQARCRDPRLRIDTKFSHTRIVTRCLEIMDQYLKRNILGLSDPAQFMSNEDGLKEDGKTEAQLQEKIPQQLRYACVDWVNHLEIANIDGSDLMHGLERFVDEHMLYWFEVLSLIGKLDLAHHAIGVALKLLESRSSDLHQLLSDALRFIGKFYEVIKRSALHTYYSALPFTPSDSLLYRRYNKEVVHNICGISGGPEQWDALVTNQRHEEHVQVIKFSLDSALFATRSQIRGLQICDAATGTPISTISGHRFAVANDFSTVASFEDKTITFYNVNGSIKGAMLTTSSRIRKLALSSESSRVAAALSDGTVWLWDSGNAKSLDSLDGYHGYWSWLQFSSTGTRLAYSSANGIKLRDGISGRFIADLQCGSTSRRYVEFSGDGSRVVSVSPDDGLTLWNSESGQLIAAVRNIGRHRLAISANGSLLATADHDKVTLWSENCDSLTKIKVLELSNWSSMVFSPDNILAIVTFDGIKFYNVNTHSFIHTLPLGGSSIAFSPDRTRFVVGDKDHNVKLWDMRVIDASPSSKGNATAVTALALSRDCSRLACGFRDGTVELWGISPTKRRIDPLTLRSQVEAVFLRIFSQSRHTESVQALGFGRDGRLFASGSSDGTIKVWNGGDGALYGTLKTPGRLQAVALSNSVLVAAWEGWDEQEGWRGGITLWSFDTLNPIHTFKRYDGSSEVLIAENRTLIAVCLHCCYVDLLDTVNRTTITTFNVPFNFINTMTFLPDNSQLIVQSNEGDFLSLNLSNKRVIKGPTLEHLIQLPNIPLWRGVPIWHCQDKNSEQHYFAALFSQQKNPVPVLWIPRQIPVTTWTQGSSMVALGCKDGRVILLRLFTTPVTR